MFRDLRALARRRTAALPASIAGFGLLLAACGGGGPNPTLAKAVNGLHTIHSGVLQVEALYVGGPGAGGGGFNLYGSFAEPVKAGGPPVADLSVSGIGGGSNSSTLVSDGTRVVVERGGVVYPVTGKALRQMGDPTNADLVGLGALGVASWGVPPIKTTRANGAVRLTAAADPVAAINGIVALANEVSVTTSRLHTVSGDSASVLRKNLTSGSFSLRYGVSDHLLQFFWVELVFRPAALPVLRASLGPNAGTDVSMAVSVTQVNQPQHVTVPTVPT